MIHALIRASISTTRLLIPQWSKGNYQQHLLFMMIALLLAGSLQFSTHTQAAHAQEGAIHYGCRWYTIHSGDTLGQIANNAHVNVQTLALANNITNINLIFAGRPLCIPQAAAPSAYHAGVLTNGLVRWYAYDALEWSNQQNATALLQRAAASYGLPAKLILAIAWQESNLQQHVISKDGGIGMMQIMPATAMWINTATGMKRDPYKLADNIFMGAFYIRILCNTFNWNIVHVVSAYNEGGWTLTHRGIINWNYVNRVITTIHNLR